MKLTAAVAVLAVSLLTFLLSDAVNTAAAATAAPRVHTVLIEGMRYQPEGITVAAGDTVVWVNRDMVPHPPRRRPDASIRTKLPQASRGRIPSELRVSSHTSAPTIR
jgi:plastocyanin